MGKGYLVMSLTLQANISDQMPFLRNNGLALVSNPIFFKTNQWISYSQAKPL